MNTPKTDKVLVDMSSSTITVKTPYVRADFARGLEVEMDKLKAENIALRSMCYTAAKEIEDQWEYHCDEEGYGPRNLLFRLLGKLPPDLYAGGISEEEEKFYTEYKLKNLRTSY